MVGTKICFHTRCKIDVPKGAESFVLIALLVWQILREHRKRTGEIASALPQSGAGLTHGFGCGVVLVYNMSETNVLTQEINT